MEPEAMKRRTNIQNGTPPAPGLLFRLFHDSGSFPLDPLSISLFSSRRRHTSWPRDWSSDVCSSDLNLSSPVPSLSCCLVCGKVSGTLLGVGLVGFAAVAAFRSEERRVGKECRSRWSAEG